MHEFLRSIGFRSYTTKKQIRELIDWVLEAPDHLNIISLDNEANLSVAEREIGGGAGISVVGEIDEKGTFVPEYYFPQLVSHQISSEAAVSCRKEASRDAYIGMCEDYRFGMATIFNVRNVAETARNEVNGLMEAAYTKAALSALASDATILLPLYQPEMVLQKGREDLETHTKLLESARSGDQDAIERLTREDLEQYQQVMTRLKDSDVYTLVESFIIPYGMESSQYYLFGRIVSVNDFKNPKTGETFYRMTIEVNGMTMLLAVNKEDLTGIPYEGARIRAHAWMTGDLIR